MKQLSIKRVAVIIVYVIITMCLVPNIAMWANAEECPLYGTHHLDGAVMFEADHPHKQYVVCDCGYAKYTGGTQGYYSECPICNPKECPVYGSHRFSESVMFEADHPHKQYVVCDCGYAKYTGGTQGYYSECPICNPKECPVYGSHRFSESVMFEADHPHKQYVVCDCGYAKYTGGTQGYYSECEICNPKESGSNGTNTNDNNECQHPTTAEAWDEPRPTYRSISDSEHEVSGYLYQYCTVCMKRISDRYPATETERHHFDSAGDCPTCGYTRSCKHENTKYVIIDGFPTYRQHNEKQHIYDVQYKEVCANPSCGKTVKKVVDSQRIYEYQNHRFDGNGKCLDCGYVRQEQWQALNVSVSRGQSTAKTGDTISASASASGGDGGYKYAWTVKRDGAEIQRTDLGMGSSYNWKADKAGSYVFSVTVKDGSNDQATASSQSIVVSESECTHELCIDIVGTARYEQISDTKHKKVTPIERICNNCRKTISNFNEETTEDHTFVNGECSLCHVVAATKECQHLHTEERYEGKEIVNQGNADQHIVEKTYSNYCQDCQRSISTYTKREMENHTFNEYGVCSCGYAKPAGVVYVEVELVEADDNETGICDHANREEIPISEPTYENNEAAGHTKRQMVRIQCADCGIPIEEKEKVTTENHRYENGYCVCGQQEHMHIFQKQIIDRQYINQNLDEHDVVESYKTVCSTCGESNGPFTNTIREAHDYNDKGHHQELHENGLGHAAFDKCICGATKITGYIKDSNCCECGNHSWGEPYQDNGVWMHKCLKCNSTEITSSIPDTVHAITEKTNEIIDATNKIIETAQEIKQDNCDHVFIVNAKINFT